MKKLYLFLLVTVSAIVITTVVVFHYFTKPLEKTQDVVTDVKIPATQFAAEFVKDSATAIKKYELRERGAVKFLELSGKIGRTETSADSNIHVFFVTPQAEIQCTMQSDQTAYAKTLKEGQDIVLKGNLTGYLEPDVDLGEEAGTIKLNRCVLVQ